jgi:hypothetical protein
MCLRDPSGAVPSHPSRYIFQNIQGPGCGERREMEEPPKAMATMDIEQFFAPRKSHVFKDLTFIFDVPQMNLGFGSLITFVFYQWTQQCAAGATVFASVTALFFILGSLAFVTFLILRTAKRPGGIEQLFTIESTYARRWGSLYSTLKETQLSFVLVLLAAAFIRRIIIGFGQKSGLAQNILLILLELAMFIGT